MQRTLLYQRATRTTAIGIFVVGLAMLCYELRWLNNSFDIGPSVFGALVAASFIVLLVHRLDWLVHTNPPDRLMVWTFFVLGVGALLVGGASLVNRALAAPLPTTEWVVAEKMRTEPRHGSRERWKVRLKVSNELHWFSITRAEWQTVESGQPYRMKVFVGPLGVGFGIPPPW